MDEMKDPLTDVKIDTYEGVPNKQNHKELSSWKKFLRFIVPWLGEKRQLGDRLLRARVAKEEAEALSIIADAKMKFEQSRKIAAEASKIEQELLRETNIVDIPQEEIEIRKKDLEKRLKYLRIVHGFEIEIRNKNNFDD